GRPGRGPRNPPLCRGRSRPGPSPPGGCATITSVVEEVSVGTSASASLPFAPLDGAFCGRCLPGRLRRRPPRLVANSARSGPLVIRASESANNSPDSVSSGALRFLADPRLLDDFFWLAFAVAVL